MKIFFIIFLICTTSYAQESWDSSFPKHINELIFKTTHYKCHYSDYIDGIIAEEIVHTPLKSIYTASFSLFGDPGYGFIQIQENVNKELSVIGLDCPNIFSL